MSLFNDKTENKHLSRDDESLKNILIWGINYTLSQMIRVTPKLVLLADDFRASIKIKVENFNFNSENMPVSYKFKEYTPMVFHYLRKRFQISTQLLQASFTKQDIIWDNRKGHSKYIFSFNRLFCVKLISLHELEVLLNLLSDYHEYLVNRSYKTLLPQFLALYKIVVNEHAYYLLMFRSITSPRLVLKYMFNLKGSTPEKTMNTVLRKNEDSVVMNDSEFIDMDMKLYLGDEKKKYFMLMLTSDVQFLQQRNLVQYGLFVGIFYTFAEMEKKKKADDSKDKFAETDYKYYLEQQPFNGELHPVFEWSAVQGSEPNKSVVYFFGIVNILKKYNGKRISTPRYLKPNGESSSMTPETYAKRFMSKITYSVV